MRLRSLLFIPALLASAAASAQTWVHDTVSMGAGYANDVFYSLKNDEQKVEPADSWHLGFQLIPQAGPNSNVAILANHVGGDVMVYSMHMQASTKFGNLTTADTVGLTPLYNADTSWEYGAFNQMAGAGPFDFSWGTYNMTTHNVDGDSLYLVTVGGAAYQVWVQQYKSTPVDSIQYRFRIALFDGTEDTTIRIYRNPQFSDNVNGYYNILTKSLVDREPNRYTWDLLFTEYITPIAMGPGPLVPYPVAGLLQNKGVSVTEVNNVDPDTTTYTNYLGQLSNYINEIGYDWKTFNMTTFQYEIDDSTTYFIKTQNTSEYWQVVFTDFGGSATGDFMFKKRLLGPTKVSDVTSNLVAYHLAPNPATNELQVMMDVKENVSNARLIITDMAGRVVKQNAINLQKGLNAYKVNTSAMTAGTYIVTVAGENVKMAEKLVVQH